MAQTMSKLLIVDDEPEFLGELAEALTFRGVTSQCVPRAADAVPALRADPEIRVVVTDIRMPDMDGVVLIETVKAHFPDRPIKFVVMTGHAAEVDIRRAEVAGASAWFPKPLAFPEFCDALAAIGGDDERG